MDDEPADKLWRQRYQHRPALDPHGPFWQGYQWSRWYDFPDLLDARAEGEVSVNAAGVYRFCVPRRRGLLYIGQSGRLRQRLLRHRRAVQDIQGPQKRPHLGFHHALARHLSVDGRVRVSWTSLEGMSTFDRLGVECDLISAHRTIVGRNPDWQFRPVGGDEDVLE